MNSQLNEYYENDAARFWNPEHGYSGRDHVVAEFISLKKIF